MSEPIENHVISNEPSYHNLDKKHLQKRHRICRRDREPSRIPVRTLQRLSNKSRKVREFVYKCMCSSTPWSSKMYCYIKVRKLKLELKSSETLRKSILKFKSQTVRYCSLFSCNRVTCLYKSQTHVANYCKLKLSTDIEKNPGPRPMYVDPSKTIAAPYSQGNELVFGQNAGQQCVAMSLCSLIYNNKQGISSGNDLIQIMNIGNQLYSSLSQLARQSYLMQTELPTMLNVLDTDYQLEYSESYTGTVGQETAIEGYQYCTSLQIAFESLLSQNYTNFILTVGCVGVSIYCNVDVGFKIFDSHARDVYGRAHPQGTCVLLKALSLDSLVCYFQSLHNNDMFEVKGVHVNAIQNSIVLPQDCAHETVNFNLSCVVAIYSLCYSIMKSCSYWNLNTLATIVDNSKRVCDNLCLNGCISASNLPKTVDVCGTEVSFNVLSDNKEGLLCDSVQSKSILEDAIINNNECTGFLMWLPCYCISCIYKPTKKSKYTYALLVYNENHIQTIQYTKNINGTASLVEAVSTIQKEYKSTGHYKIQFVSCSCANVDRSERKKNMKNHRQKQDYEAMEPSKKKIFLEKKQVRDMTNKQDLQRKRAEQYKTMDTAKKQDLLNEQYRTMDTAKKQDLLSEKAEQYKTMDTAKKQDLLNKKAEQYKTMETAKKQDLLSEKAEQYKTMDTAKKQDLLNKKAEQYKTMDATKKQKLLEKSKEIYTSHNSKKTVDSCVEQFKKKILEGPYHICCVCNRTLYKKSILKLNTSSYPSQDIFKIQSSYDGKEYICKTCHSKAIQGRLPCQAVVNNLNVDDVPTELGNLKKLEQILIAQRIIFEKVIVMPKGQQRKIKGAICNVPVNCDETCNILPRPPERSGIILLKLKRKLQFRGHVYFQPVRPEFIMTALHWLTANNPLYKDIQIDCGNIDVQLTDMTHNENYQTTLLTNPPPADYSSSTSVNENRAEPDNMVTSLEVNSSIEASKDNSSEALNEEEVEDPLNEHGSPASETCLQSVIPDYPILTEEQNSSNSSGTEVYNIAPGENKHPVSLMNDKLCEELAFPVLFPKGRFGYAAKRQIKITPVKYFNGRLLHHSGRFASNPEYLFFAQFIIEQKKVSDNIYIALKKVHGQNVTASQVRTNTQILQNLISQDQAYLFLRQIPGSSPYWQKFMYEVVAMV